MSMDLSRLTISEARRALDAKEYSARELTEAYFDAIRAGDGDIRAYLEVWDGYARREADVADVLIARGESKSLTGIPLALKDNILVRGRIASAASKILEGYRASYDAAVVEKLRGEGAIFLGRANQDEFAMGGSTENSAFGPTKNPLDLARVPGGSSGGSAAAVAGSFALAALGSDTGGSIRQPAALCGIVGLKPTYGAVSRFGLIAMGSSLDQIGPLTRSVEDARLVFDAIRGHDKRDSTSLPERPSNGHAGKRIGVPRTFLESGVDPDVRASFEETLTHLAGRGYDIVDIELPTVRYGLAMYYIIMPAEASTNLARFDGIRYGYSAPAETIAEVYAKSRGEGFGAEVRRRILTGTFVLSAGYADAYYRKARDARRRLTREFTDAFERVDAIATPTSPTPAWKLGEKADPLSMYAADIFTVPVNLAGVPAMSVPSGSVVRDGVTLPVGFQLIAGAGREDVLFSFGADVEKGSI